jgi:uncharacterized protein YgiM (DUF1202 family)
MKRTFAIAAIALSIGVAPLAAQAEHTRPAWMNNENVGKFAGAAVGALLGSQIGDGRGQLAATAAGAVGGYILGERIGRQWPSHGQTSHSTGGRHYASHQSRYPSGGRGNLQPLTYMPDLHRIDRTYAARTTSNVRGGPSPQFVVVDTLRPGERARVLGKVVGTDWYMVAQGDIIQGFVYAPLMDPVSSHAESYSYGGGWR